ncbi:endonuclease/exonuclease/phosphatase family protein [Niabella aquatica]
MKNTFLLSWVMLTVSAFSQSTYKSAIIGFYNFENFYDTIFHGSYDDAAFTPNGSKAYTSAVFNDKVAKLAGVLSQIGTDLNPDGPALLGTAEIENKYVLDTLLRHPLIAERKYKYVHYDSKDFRGVDVALIYNPEYFKVEKSRPVFVKIPAGTKNAVYTRDVLWVRGLLNGERMHVFVNHWPSRSGGEKRSQPARMAAATTVRKFIDSLLIIDPASKIIVMGDLNDDPVSSSVTKGLKAPGDVKNIRMDDLYNPWVSMYKSGQGTLAYQDAWSLFDQILFSSSFLNRNQEGFFYYRHHVFKADYMIENTGRYKGYPMRTYNGDVYRGGYSDHFPTYIVLLKKVE